MYSKIITFKDPSVQMAVTDLQPGYYIVCGRGRGTYRGWILTMSPSNKVININLALDLKASPLQKTKIMHYTLNDGQLIRVYPLKKLSHIDLHQLEKQINGHASKPEPKPKTKKKVVKKVVKNIKQKIRPGLISSTLQIRPTISSDKIRTVEVDIDHKLFELLDKYDVKIISKNLIHVKMFFRALIDQKRFPSFYNYSLGYNTLFAHLKREIEHYAPIRHDGNTIFQLALVINKDNRKNNQLEISLNNFSPSSGDPINTPLRFYCLKKFIL